MRERRKVVFFVFLSTHRGFEFVFDVSEESLQ